MEPFDYGRAEADLYEAGCPDPEEIYEYKSEKGIRDFMGENGLNADNYYSNNNNTNSSGSTGCYLTTACIVAKGLPDDCDELQTLRDYRDTYLRKRPNGESDIKEYYSIAPKIVASINQLSNSNSVWDTIYHELIEYCVKMIRNDRFEEAYLHYKQYTYMLFNEYNNSNIGDNKEE